MAKVEGNNSEDRSAVGDRPEAQPPARFTAAALRAFLGLLRELATREKVAVDADSPPRAAIPPSPTGRPQPKEATGRYQPVDGTPAQSQQ